MAKYRWSSYPEYLKKRSSFINTEFVLKLFHAFSDDPIAEFQKFHKQNRAFKSSLSERPKRTQAEVLEQMKSVLGSTQLFEVGSLKREERDALLASLKREGFTVRQIERATGVPRSVVGRA